MLVRDVRPWMPILLAGALCAAAPGAAEEEDPPKLLGRCTTAQLEAEPFSEWYVAGHDAYVGDPQVLRSLRNAGLDGVEVTIFFGAWCGDSRREVPRMVKLLEQAGLPTARVHLIAVDRGGDAHKRSPDGEERGREIYRVPTLVVERAGRELSRIVEFPVLSLERDLLAILSDVGYQPNYASYPAIREWLAAGLLADPNVSARGLAGRLRLRVASEGELEAAATVLESRGQRVEALKLLETNCVLHGESAGCHARLAEALLDAGRAEVARAAAERAIRLNDDPSRTQDLLDLLARAVPR